MRDTMRALGGALKIAALAAIMPIMAGSSSHARADDLPKLETNQFYLEELERTRKGLDVGDPLAVLEFVMSRLPERVKVYPTENYYYFRFYHGGQRYAGNIRLDVVERDKGLVNFAYFKDLAEWTEQAPVIHRLLGAREGVKVEKVADLVYRITFRNRSIVFALNDLRDVRPPEGMLTASERYIGPVFDEAGIQFLLVYNSTLKVFHYVLDERRPNTDPLVATRATDRILIGQRTGFAYYDDRKQKRKILIGVHEANARVNNYFDGPFDQLPDNFLQGETLRSAILEVEPQLKGKIDRFGISPGGADRYMIAPYLHYRSEQDLMVFHACATSREIPTARYYGCFSVKEEGFDGEPPLLAAEQMPTPQAPSPAGKKAPAHAGR